MSNQSLILYHGTIYDFDRIDVNCGKPFKDFGRGFYTTQNREHAVSIAARNREMIIARQNKTDTESDIKMRLYTYEFPTAIPEELSVKEFPEPTREWMLFVGANRTNADCRHEYDIVIGPTANDRTNLSIKTYFFGGYGDVGSDDAIDILLKIIKPNELPHQIFFGTDKAVNYLTRIKTEVIQ
ncbi:MAG: DUF3990 domain-containing protein [Planctomycetaceae bacterium]|jgi:hypothetical protein|nr:DUF3990 domain-containing protein [Planctomycetaceae bacterium]